MWINFHMKLINMKLKNMVGHSLYSFFHYHYHLVLLTVLKCTGA